MRRFGRSALYGVLFGLATAAVAEAVRPRGGTTLLLDWDEVRRTARARLDDPTMERGALANSAMGYRSHAKKLERPLLNFVGGLPRGASMRSFEGADRLRHAQRQLGCAVRRLRGGAAGAVAGRASGSGHDVGDRGLQQPGHEPARPGAPAGVRAPRAGLPGAELRQERARGPDLEADRARSQAPAVPARRSLLSGGLRSPRDGGPEPGVVRTGVDAEAQRAGQPGRVVPPDFRLVP